MRVFEGYAVDLFAVETAVWPRYEVKAAAVHLKGRGDFANMFVFDIPPGAATAPQRHLYEDVVYVLEGTGSTQIEFADGRKRSFEWGPRSLFAIPLNARHRHFNGSGRDRALIVSTTDLPLVMNTFHDAGFVFETDYEFTARSGKTEYFAGEGDLITVRPGNHMWETNFVPDRAEILGRPRRRRHQHHVRARRRHHACPHLGNAGRHLQEGPPPRAGLSRHVRHRPRLFIAVVRGRQGLPAARLETRRGVPPRRPAVPSAFQHQHIPGALSRDRRRRAALSAHYAAAPLAARHQARREGRGVGRHQGRRRPDRIRGPGPAHPSAVAR